MQMADRNHDEFREIRELWNVLCSISASQGVDAGNLALGWAKAKRNSLLKWASENSFDELCNAGCSPVSLAISLWAIQACRRWQKTWRVTIGSVRRRDQIVRSLENAANNLEELQNSFYGALLEDLRESSNDIETGDNDIHSLNAEHTWPSYAPGPSPSTTIRALHLYARVLGFFDTISEETQAHSAETVSKYLISGYVNRATGKFHDPEVSALIGSALETGTYDETAHRMWRSRNYEQLETGFHKLAELPQSMRRHRTR
jgi:hypothetical protein